MNTLWIYGCSFSEPFGLVPEGLPTLNDLDKSRFFHGVEYWGTHLAKLLNVDIVNKSFPGVGWNYINNRIDEDLIKWSKDDYVIINPSFFTRATFEEITKGLSMGDMAPILKDSLVVSEFNELRWKHKIETLIHLGYKNVYTWIIDHSKLAESVSQLITTPSLQTNWKMWMDENKEYWIDPIANPPHGDWHFNPQGHIQVAKRMYEFIIGNTHGHKES